MTHLRQIVYVSTALKELTAPELESLLSSARRQNQQNGITGVLLYNEGDFMQCLEGPEDMALLTYQRILSSSQHKNVIELMNERVAQRGFQDWEMGLARPTKSELLALSTARWKMQADRVAALQQAPAGLQLLQAFWRTARRETY